MAKVTSKKKKPTQKTARSWEELLVEKVMAMIMERDRQINESADRFEQQMKEKNRQIIESADRFEQQMKEKNRQINESADRFEQQMKENAELTSRQMRESEIEWEMRVSSEQNGRKIKRTDRWIDRLNRYAEDPVRYIDLPNLMQKFNELDLF